MDTLDVSQIQKPTNRGKFSPDRDFWDGLHQQRFLQWQMGLPVEDIAESEGVTANAVRASIIKCEGRLPGREVLAIRDLRHKLRTIDRLGPKCLDVLEGLLADDNPFVRLKTVEQVRKTLTAESGGGVQVNTQVNVENRPGKDLFDFETEVAKLRQQQKAAHSQDRQTVVDISPQTACQEEQHEQ